MSNDKPAGGRQKIRIGDLLVKHGVISEEQLMTALTRQKKTGTKLGNTLVEMGLVSAQQFHEFLADQLNLPFIDLKHYSYAAETVRLLPETAARRFRAIVLSRDGEQLLVGLADATDLHAYDELSRILKKPLRLAVVYESELLRILDIVYRRTQEIVSLAEELGEELSQGDSNLEQLLTTADVEDAPVVRLLRSLFEDAVQVGASDIHIEPDEKVLRIRQRIDGVLHEQVMKEKRIGTALVSRLKLVCGLDISERRLPQDGRFNVRVKGHSVDIRLSTMPLQYGESVVMRLLDQSGGLLDLSHIGMNEDILQRFRAQLSQPHGLVLVTGPTGSGKTTTLYGALNQLNTFEKKIITVEDPVEYRLPRINQVQVHPKIGLDFARVLRAGLRQDPDVVMVGEMRDKETADIALRAAMTGHLVLSTLHTNDSVSTALRLIEMGAAGYVVASSLRSVLAQRLVRRICDSCVTSDSLEPGERAWLKGYRGKVKRPEGTLTFKKGQGCPSCNNTGYKGRIGIFELLEIDFELADALRRNDSSAFALAVRRLPHFVSLGDSALKLALEGVTTMEEVLRIAGQVAENPLAERISVDATGAETETSQQPAEQDH
ncbi:GspE/PulE family protein [Pelovirga terrestris]|uniref:Type II/IV secretion system protein n=1 Tax=Pelovirga terrestris TaxID=2771352 RepID=A0A8J6UIP2_9BACT|nr:GspE/PulE family protein [Pelovirga terrestris]MBD1401415.1 type II/IV secretion system protein [Pelovirga terrestris]